MSMPAELSVSDDSPRLSADGAVNNQITLTLSVGGQKMVRFQCNRLDLQGLISSFPETIRIVKIPAKMSV